MKNWKIIFQGFSGWWVGNEKEEYFSGKNSSEQFQQFVSEAADGCVVCVTSIANQAELELYLRTSPRLDTSMPNNEAVINYGYAFGYVENVYDGYLRKDLLENMYSKLSPAVYCNLLKEKVKNILVGKVVGGKVLWDKGTLRLRAGKAFDAKGRDFLTNIIQKHFLYGTKTKKYSQYFSDTDISAFDICWVLKRSNYINFLEVLISGEDNGTNEGALALLYKEKIDRFVGK